MAPELGPSAKANVGETQRPLLPVKFEVTLSDEVKAFIISVPKDGVVIGYQTLDKAGDIILDENEDPVPFTRKDIIGISPYRSNPFRERGQYNLPVPGGFLPNFSDLAKIVEPEKAVDLSEPRTTSGKRRKRQGK